MAKLISIADDDVLDDTNQEVISANTDITLNKSIDSDEDEGDIISLSDFSSNETTRYKSLDRFFKKLELKKKQLMVDIINKQSDISLRILDKFVTKYCNKTNITYKINKDDEDEFNVHISYKAQLKSYRKRFFDPFRRGTKFFYFYDKDDKKKKTLTTLGQLNFFKWAFTNKIIEYVYKNKNDIVKTICKWDKESLGRKKEYKKINNKNNLYIKKIYNSDDIQKKDNKIILTFD